MIPAVLSGFGPGDTKKNQNYPLHPVWYAPVMPCCVISIFPVIDACFLCCCFLEGPNFWGEEAKAKILQRQDGRFHI